MSGYKLIKEGYSYRTSETETVGVRYYETDATGSDSLPTIGVTGFPTSGGGTLSGVVCRSLEEIYRGSGAQVTTWKAVFRTADIESGGGEEITTQSSSRRFSVGGEIASIIDASDSWVWESDGDPVDQKMGKHIVTISFTVPKLDMTAAENTSWLSGLSSYVGRINNASFEGFNSGCVLFEGVTGGSFYNEDGDLRFSYEMNFLVRIVPGQATDSWQYLFRDNTGYFDLPTDDTGTARLYSTANFGAL